MRIIGGMYRSRPLAAPKGQTTRPTLDQVREALFNILQGATEGIAVLDLYGGSGAVALEALSRGAASAVIADQSRDAVEVIRKNVASLSCGDRAEVIRGKDEAVLSQLAARGKAFDLIYLDPPYELDPSRVIVRLCESGLLKPGGQLVWEHASARVPGDFPGLARVSTRRYRDTSLTFYVHAGLNAGQGGSGE